MKKIYTSANRVKIYLLKAMLEEMDIVCLIKNEDAAGQAAGEIPPVSAMPELWVMDDEQYDTALAAIHAEENVSSHTYLTWICPSCHEKLEAQFNVCWKCGTSR